MLETTRQQSTLSEITQFDYRLMVLTALRRVAVSDTLSEHELSLIEWAWKTGTIPEFCCSIIRIDRRNAGAIHVNKIFAGVAEPVGYGRYRPVIACISYNGTTRFLVQGAPNLEHEDVAKAMADEWAVHADKQVREALAGIGLTEEV